MATQNFLSTDFFLLASEEEAKAVLLSLPGFNPNITLLKENALAHSTRFLYDHPVKQIQNYVDVSIRPLNDKHVLVKLHGSYTNGKSFHADPDIKNALRQFEFAVCSLLKRDDSVAQVQKSPQPSSPAKRSGFLTGTLMSLFFSRSARSV